MGGNAKTRSTNPAESLGGQTSVWYHKPGSPPEKVKFKKGTTVADAIADLNVEGYSVRLNGEEVSASDTVTLKTGDVLKVGVKTKNA